MRSTLLAIAAVAGIASAQLPYQQCTIPTMTMNWGGVQTITQTYTSTYCPACPSVVTTYTTVYSQFCPAGLTSQEYTVTETCAPGNCRTGLPPGFTTSVGVCNVCGPQPVTATITQPCTEGPEATQVQEYPTVYQTWGPNGLIPATYTVTASCAATPCPAPAPGYPAPGFTTTVQACSTCGPTPITATLTVPAATNVAAVGGVAPAATGGSTGIAPATYTGAASSDAVSYLAAGIAGLVALARLL